jgi:Fe-S cluster assembly protein SufD
MSTPLAQRIAQEFSSHQHPALEELRVRGLPTSRDENWKYANLRPLERVRFAPASPDREPLVQMEDLPAAIEGYARYTFVDGIFAPQLSNVPAQSAVQVLPMRGLSRERPPSLTAADERFALLNEAFATDGARIVVSEGVNCAECLELVFVASADAQTASSYPRVELDVGSRAQLGVIERHISHGSDANFINSAVRINVSRGANVTHYRVQQSGARATWIDTLTATMAEDAAYQLYLINLGAAAARSTMHIYLAGERADFGLHSASVADRQQTHDAFALVEHVAANTRSRQSFRGIAGGRSRVAFNSKVVVQQEARGTDSYQSLRGLLAGPEAEIDTRPQLEIYTDDVRCAHGATAGKLDENMLFYMLSRGLERATAQRLLEWAFLEDVVAKIAVPELRRQIETSLAGQMKEPVALEALDP